MAGDQLEQAFYYSLGLAQQGVQMPQIRVQLMQSGWPEPDIQHILYRVEQQLASSNRSRRCSSPPSTSPPSHTSHTSASQPPISGGHSSKGSVKPTAIWDGKSKTNRSRSKTAADKGHVSKAFRRLVLDMTDQTLDLAEINFMGPILLVVGGLILLAGLMGLLLLVATNQGESVKAMQFPVIIGVTFVKAGIDTYLKKSKS